MPRGIGASVGVKDSVTGSPAAADSVCSISGVCWWAPPALYADIEPITSLPSRCGRGAAPGAGVPDAATTTTSSGSTSPAASSGASAEGDRGRVAAGVGDPRRPRDALARAGQLGQAVRPRCPRGRRRRTLPRGRRPPAGSRRRGRRPAPRAAAAAARAADSPCGSARNTTSARPAASAGRSPGRRAGRGRPGAGGPRPAAARRWLAAVSAPERRRPGGRRAAAASSPPAYPLAPATATRVAMPPPPSRSDRRYTDSGKNMQTRETSVSPCGRSTAPLSPAAPPRWPGWPRPPRRPAPRGLLGGEGAVGGAEPQRERQRPPARADLRRRCRRRTAAPTPAGRRRPARSAASTSAAGTAASSDQRDVLLGHREGRRSARRRRDCSTVAAISDVQVELERRPVRAGRPERADAPVGCSSPACPTAAAVRRVQRRAHRPGCHGACSSRGARHRGSTDRRGTTARRLDGVGPGRAARPGPHQPGSSRAPASDRRDAARLARQRASSAASSSSARTAVAPAGRGAAAGASRIAAGTTTPASNSATSVVPRPTLRRSASSRPGSSVVRSTGSSSDSGLASRTPGGGIVGGQTERRRGRRGRRTGRCSTSTKPALGQRARPTRRREPLAARSVPTAGGRRGSTDGIGVVAAQPGDLLDEVAPRSTRSGRHVGGDDRRARPRRPRVDRAADLAPAADRPRAAGSSTPTTRPGRSAASQPMGGAGPQVDLRRPRAPGPPPSSTSSRTAELGRPRGEAGVDPALEPAARPRWTACAAVTGGRSRVGVEVGRLEHDRRRLAASTSVLAAAHDAGQGDRRRCRR